ncbi:MAG: M1 family metallopeptidase [Cyclobacteriaceae bacterium]|nr:M1 family metallopeptidase [Cyclobacteriaceae bacterium HetDA_MAG_MS6]
MKYKYMKISSVLGALFLSLVADAQGYWQQRVEYTMSIDFDVAKHQFVGDQTLVYYNNSPDSLEKVFYHLYFNAFQPNSMMDVRSRNLEDPDKRVMDRISKLSPEEIGYHEVLELSQDGEPLKFIVEGTILEVDLSKAIAPGSSAVFNMKFRSQVPKQIRRSGRNNKEGIDYSMAQWFPKMAEYDTRGWHAHPYIAREFYAPWGSYDVEISIDKDYILAATGVLQNPEEIGYGYYNGQVTSTDSDKLSWKFSAENVHDFVWAADRDYKHHTVEVPEGPLLHFFFQTDTLVENWEKLAEYTLKAFDFVQKNFGEYPFPQYSIIQGGDGGMEYPMATLITGHRSLRSLVGVTVHELMHSWYQGLLATNESYYAWMDEGYTTYATGLTMDHIFKENGTRSLMSSYGSYFDLAASGIEEPMSVHSDHFSTNYAYGKAAYQKGAVSLAQLGYIIGLKNRDEGLKKYYYQWRFKHPQLNDFVRVMEKQSGLELDWYYDYWVNTTHTIDYAVQTVAKAKKKTKIVLKRVGKMPMPIDLLITLKEGTQQLYYIPLGLMRGEKPNESDLDRVIGRDWPWTHPTYEFELNLPMSKIQEIEIDPLHLMADVDIENNKFSLNKK